MEALIHNACILSEEDKKKISSVKVAVIGAGGLGGFLLNGLARLGVKHITIIDFDVFQPSNLNRQLFCTASTIGKSKADVSRRVLRSITDIEAVVIEEKLTEDNVAGLLGGVNIVFDAVDNAETKLILEKQCIIQNIPLIHGGVNGSHGQAAIIEGQPVLERLFKAPAKSQNAVIMPQLISALQLNLFIKLIKNEYTAGAVYYFDGLAMELVTLTEA